MPSMPACVGTRPMRAVGLAVSLWLIGSADAMKPPSSTCRQAEVASEPPVVSYFRYHGIGSKPVLELHIGSEVELQPQLTAQRLGQRCRWNFTVEPSLPLGLQLDEYTGVVSGMPRRITPIFTYIFTAACTVQDGDAYSGSGANQTQVTMAVGTGKIRTIAGTGSKGRTSLAPVALPGYMQELDLPESLCAHRDKVYIGQRESIAVLDVNTEISYVLLGVPGEAGCGGDGLPKEHARVKHVTGMVVVNEELFFADYHCHCVRKVGLPGSSAPGVVERVVGTGKGSYLGDGDLGKKALLNNPVGLAANFDGNRLYIASCRGHRVRVYDLDTGIIDTFAGNGESGFSGDGGDARDASMHCPSGLLWTEAFLYVADRANGRVRGIDLRQSKPRTILTIAGGGRGGFRQDGALATDWDLGHPLGLALGPAGFMYIATDHMVVAADLLKRNDQFVLTRVMGSGAGEKGRELVAANTSPLNLAYGLAVTRNMLFVCDRSNHRVRSAPVFGMNSLEEVDARAVAEHIIGPWGYSKWAWTPRIIHNDVMPLPLAAGKYHSSPLPVALRSRITFRFHFLFTGSKDEEIMLIGLQRAGRVMLQIDVTSSKDCRKDRELCKFKGGNRTNTISGAVLQEKGKNDRTVHYTFENVALNGNELRCRAETKHRSGHGSHDDPVSIVVENGRILHIPASHPPEAEVEIEA